LLSRAYAGTVPQGGSCSSDSNHLDPATHRLLTECNDKNFCSAPANGTCVPKKCVRDEYPFGYSPEETVPPPCAYGTFCPDEGSGCKALLTVGQPCQLNRDEQCAPPPILANESICLQNKCRYGNVTLAQPCQLENTTYIDFDITGGQFTTTVIRDNCRIPDFFCDPATMLCEQTKPVGTICRTDGECKTHNCSGNGHCADQPEVPLKVTPWQYGITTLCIFATLGTTCVALKSVHQRRAKQQHQEVRDYCDEQASLRRAVISLHEAAAGRFEGEKKQESAAKA